MAQKVKALSWKPDDLRSLCRERRDQPLHVVLTLNAAVVCTNPHTKLIHVTQKGEQTSEGYIARNVNGQNRLHSATDTTRTRTCIRRLKL